MSEPLSGKVVLVTGGAKRVGAAIARRLHREGANLMLHYRGSEREARALVNKASTFFPTPVGEMNQATWDSLMGANLRAPLFLSQAAAPHLKKRSAEHT